MKVNILILAGGKSLRMDGFPKCLTLVKGRTIMEWELDWISEIKKYINKVIISCGYNKEVFEYIQEIKKRYSYNITSFFDDNKPLGDAGAIKKAFNYCKNSEILLSMNGDTISLFSLKQIFDNIDVLKKGNYFGIIVCKPCKVPWGLLSVSREVNKNIYEISSFKEKPILEFNSCFSKNSFYISCGIYILMKKMYRLLPVSGDFAKDVLQYNYDKFLMYLINEDEWYAIETLKDKENFLQMIK